MKRALILLPLLVAIAGCPNKNAQLGPAELKLFTSATELKQYLVDQYRNDMQRSAGLGGLLGGVALPTSAGEADTGNNSASGSFSSTNVQVEGVDESDMVKTDGTYVYSVNNMTFNILAAVPADQMSLPGQLALDLPARDMYLLGKQAIVLSQTDGGYGYFYPYFVGGAVPVVATGAPTGAAEGDSGSASGPQPAPWLTSAPTFDVYVIDITDPANPTLTKKFSFEGGLETSRLIGNKLFLVTDTWLDTSGVLQFNGVNKTNVEDILPRYRTVAAGQETTNPLVTWNDVLHPANPDGYNLTTIVTIDLANLDTAPASTGIMADHGTVYATPDSLYVTSTNYDWTGAAREFTEVHKFDLTGDSATYVASGNIPGCLLNQYSLDEKDGYLRTATTTGWAGGGGAVPAGGILGAILGTASTSNSNQSGNHVVVLQQNGSSLDIAGQLDGIAPGEQLYAARFVGDRGFLVTYYQVDPLFTIDLSDPSNPKKVGELEVPGYSTYIRPLDENHLFTVGKAGEPIQEGTGTFALYDGLTLSIYDVTDFANPALDQQVVLGVRGTDSEALDNPKALVFYNDMVALPVDLYEGDPTSQWAYGYHTFSGLYVYKMNVDDGFTLVGRIATVEWSDPYQWFGYNAWTRGVFIGDNVYAISNLSAQSAATADMSNILSTVQYNQAQP